MTTRGRLWLVLGVAGAGTFLGIVSVRLIVEEEEANKDYLSASDVALGLACFAGSHGGFLPNSESEFRASGIVEDVPQGGFRIETSAQWVGSHSMIIVDLERYHIRWGATFEIFFPTTRSIRSGGAMVRR